MCIQLVAVCSWCGLETFGYHLVKPCEVRAYEFSTVDLMLFNDYLSRCREYGLGSALVLHQQVQNPRGQLIFEVLMQNRPIFTIRDRTTLINTAVDAGWGSGLAWFTQQLMAGNNVGFQGVQLGHAGQYLQPGLPYMPRPALPYDQIPAREEHAAAGNDVLDDAYPDPIVDQGFGAEEFDNGEFDLNQQERDNHGTVKNRASSSTRSRIQRGGDPWTDEDDKFLVRLNAEGLSDWDIIEQYPEVFGGRTTSALETRRSRLKRTQRARARAAAANAGCKPGKVNPRREPDSDTEPEPGPGANPGTSYSEGQIAAYWEA
ncbi:hypothetical protein N657DRAFT_630037 [Parathielavia appendiculata]|uniref:Myb-like domain-containing protein n=1 Tax=Parathielavia appendiculata TaxID=2587402 RepID=A0AAN6Z8P3_9PEZI|nr:hypothetical protein N657DRAFT_630037 [Parathielavia appendiculata]